LPQLRLDGRVTRGWLGVMIQDVDEDLAHSFGLDKAEGILISQVTGNSPAQRAGLNEGDVIIRLNNRKLSDVSDLRNRIAMLAPDSRITLDVIRDGRSKKIKVTIGEQPSDFSQVTRLHNRKNSPATLEKMGMSLQELTSELAEQFGYEKGQGVIITRVAPDSPADRVGLQPGQLIEQVDKVRVRTLAELKKAIKKARNSKQILLRVRAGDFSKYLVIRAE
jgi:serine protease Do